MEKKDKKSIREKTYSKGDIAKEILKHIYEIGVVSASFVLPNLPKIYHLLGVSTARGKYKIERSLQNLQKRELIIIKDDGIKQTVKITEKGKQKMMQYKFDEVTIKRPTKWDGLWRVIIFDIPETKRAARFALSQKFRELEIYPLQKSVFVCPFKCKDEVDFIGEIFGIRDYLHYFLAKTLDKRDEDILKRFYDLK